MRRSVVSEHHVIMNFKCAMPMRLITNTILVLSLALFMACGPEGEVVSSGKDLALSVDRQVLFLNREEELTFTVSSEGRDVTGDAVIYYASGNTIDTGVAPKLKGCRFSCETAGTWTFVASRKGVESTPLQIEVIDPHSYSGAYDRHVAAFEFTGAWCTWCPKGLTIMNNVIDLDDRYKDNVHLMAFHSDSGGEDALAIDQTDMLYEHFRLTAYPSFLTDLRTGGGLDDGYAFLDSIDESLEEFPAHCGVSVTSEISDGKADITVKVRTELPLEYRVAVFLVEDGVRYKQAGVSNSDTYVHFHVVRKMVSSIWQGDRISRSALVPGEEYIKEYKGVQLDETWNAAKTSVYVLVLDYASRVNNMNICAVEGGESGYPEKKLN